MTAAIPSPSPSTPSPSPSPSAFPSVPVPRSPSGVFSAVAGSWLGKLGGLRNTVRQELVARQLDEQLTARFPGVGRRLRVLDVGPGQGTQALRLARAGHLVTGLESDPEMFDVLRAAVAEEPEGIRERVRLVEGDGREAGRHFEPGSFDVVLCHGVLMYAADPDPMLAALARVLASGGLLSLLVRNGDALAMRPGLDGDWAGTAAALDPGSATCTSRLGLVVRADRREALSATLTGLNVPLRAWYGVRVFTDTAPDDAEPPRDPAERELLLAAEERAGRTDPYRAVAALLHLCGVRD